MSDPEPGTELDATNEQGAREQGGQEQDGREKDVVPGEPDPATDQGTDAGPEPVAEPVAETPTRPQPPAMTPAEIAEHPAAMVRVSCDGRCGQPRDLYAGDTLPTDPDNTAGGDGTPAEDPRALLMAAAGCYEDPRACPGAVGDTPTADAFHAVTVRGVDLTSIDLTQMVSRVRGGRRDPELEPAVADSGIAPVPLLTVDDLELAASGEVRLPIATSPFDPPPSPMLAALGVDVENLNPDLVGMPPGATVESGEDEPDSGDEGESGDESSNPDA